jgi:DUF1680 family protein
VPGYAYACKGEDIYVNLFLGGDATVRTASNQISLKQETEYPWKGDVKIAVEPEKSGRFIVYVRIPGWARNEPVPSDLYKFEDTVPDEPVLKVNGERVTPSVEKGFARIERPWQKGDTIDLHLPMPVRRIVAHAQVKADRGKVALQRGPLVFCLEGRDNDGKVANLIIAGDAPIKTEDRPDLLNRVMVLTGEAQVAKRSTDGGVVAAGTRSFTAIPYYAWAHRGRSPMTVWAAREPQAARPEPAQ